MCFIPDDYQAVGFRLRLNSPWIAVGHYRNLPSNQTSQRTRHVLDATVSRPAMDLDGTVADYFGFEVWSIERVASSCSETICT
jgi:hypothetical protein